MTGFAIGQLPGNEEPAFTTDFHTHKAGIPAGNETVRAYREGRWAAVVCRGIELFAVSRQPAGVVHGVELGRRGEFACAELRVHILE